MDPLTPTKSHRYKSIFASDLFLGKAVIVTGGGSGIGRCIAHELASLGAKIALIGRSPEKLARVASEIHEDGGHASQHPCDIRDDDGVTRAVANVLERYGGVDGLVNNAGGQYRSDLRDMKSKGWRAVLDNNLTGGFIFSREVYRQSMEKRGGAIVNIIADIWGGWPGWAHSGAARAGMLSFTESAACEWGASGVRINAVAPGWVETSALDAYDEELKTRIRSWKAKVPLQRFATEAEISSAVVYLLSPGAAFITGSVVRVDGGVPNARPWWELQPSSHGERFEGFHRSNPANMLADKPSDSA
jgi:citronellol/citronellal dehydrogenase